MAAPDEISGCENGEQKRKSVCAPRGKSNHYVTERKDRHTGAFFPQKCIYFGGSNGIFEVFNI